jgi:hypothetical protein
VEKTIALLFIVPLYSAKSSGADRPSIGFCIEPLLGSKYDGVFVHYHGVVAEVD